MMGSVSGCTVATQVRRDRSIRAMAGRVREVMRLGVPRVFCALTHLPTPTSLSPGDAYGADVVSDLERRERLANNLV